MRHMAPFSTISSPLDNPGRFGYLNTSLSTLRHSDAVSEVDIAISRELICFRSHLCMRRLELLLVPHLVGSCCCREA